MSHLSLVKSNLVEEVIEISITYEKLINDANRATRNSLIDIHSRALIILMADCIERYRQELAIVSKRRYFLRVSNLTDWAFSLRAASNWVRHHSEWYEKYYYGMRASAASTKQRTDDESISKSFSHLGFKEYEIKNIRSVLDLINSQDIRSLLTYGNNSAYKLITKLDLTNFESSSEKFKEFIDSCTS